MADYIRPTPQNATLGAIAAALRKAQQFAGQYEVDKRIPLLGGTSVDELLSLPGAASLMEDVSYNGPRALIKGGNAATGGIGTFRLDPRVTDVADVALNAAPLAALAGKGATRGAMALGRAGERYAERVVPQIMERGGTGAELLQALTQGTRSQVVKPTKGGNWTSGSVEEAVGPLRRGNSPVLSGEIINEAAGRDLFSEYRKNYANDPTVGLYDWMRKNYPEVYAQIQGPEAAAAERFIDTKLQKYIRNEMGTPEDPVRALAERGVLHFEPARVAPGSPMERDIIAARETARSPITGLGESDLARRWEAHSDYAIQPRTAGDLTAGANKSPYWETESTVEQRLKQNPWLSKLDPETIVYHANADRVHAYGDDLGLEHLIDELKFSMDPNSGLPAALRFDPKDIDKLTVPQAVERVSKINAWRAEEAAKAERAGMMENLQATPRLADESLQLSFVEKPGGAWVDIPETVDDKGMKLCSSIGKAGGWCTQHDWAARSYGSGENRLTALVDTEGRPHAQAKITENKWPVSGEGFTQLDRQTKAQYSQYVREWRQRNPEIEELTDENVIQALKEAGVRGPAPDITELKPPGNSFDSKRALEYARRDPQYKQKVTESVLKFLNGGEWGKVADLHHYDIVDLKEPNSLLGGLKTLYGDESSRRVSQEFIDAFNYAVDTTPEAPRFMTTRQLREFIGPVEGLEGYAGGGIVKGAVKSIGELVQKYIAKEAPEAAVEETIKAAPKEHVMLQGLYRGYAGEQQPAAREFFLTPQKRVADFYAQKRSAQTGAEPHADMVLVPQNAGEVYGHGTIGMPEWGFPEPMFTNARRKIAPTDIKGRTQLYAEGGAVKFDADEIARIADEVAAQPAAAPVALPPERPVIPEDRSLPVRMMGMGDERAGMYRGRFEVPMGEYTAGVGTGGTYYNTPEGRKFTLSGREISGSMPFLGGRLSGSYYRDPKANMREARINYSRQFAAGGLVNYDPNEIDTIVSRVKEEFHG